MGITKFTLKKIQPLLKWGFDYYLSKPRKYKFKGLNLQVYPSVFHPGFFYSTKIFINFLNTINLKGKTVLELGCGSGMISLFLSRKSAVVTATDINKTAVENTKKNAELNRLKLEVIESDLFEKVDGNQFDCIIINPPYYPKKPQNEKEMAWFCGEDHEYFQKLFNQMNEFKLAKTSIYMILCEGCDLDRIKSIGNHFKFGFELVHDIKKDGEWNYIFKISQNQGMK